MKKALAKTLFTSLALIAIAGHSEQASHEDSFSHSENHVIVDSRPLSTALRQEMESKRNNESENSIFESEQQSTELSTLIIRIGDKDLATLASNHMNSTATIASPSLYHWIDLFPQENIVKTEDGAEWIFDQNDSYIIRTWRPDDVVVIAPKGKWIWGSNYSYVMTNKDLGASVDVNLFLGPVAHGSLSTWIVGIDQNNGQVYVLNGQQERSVWEISNVDLYLFKNWEVNDTLIVGVNDSWMWWFSSYNHILINVNMNHYVRARQVSSSPVYRNGGFNA